MILDLIVILLVIILSCLFCMNEKSNKSNNQYCVLSHIVIGLTVIVFYKLVRYYKIKKDLNKIDNVNNNKNKNIERFGVDESLNEFISNTADIIVNQDEKTLSDSIVKNYTAVISDLTAQIKKLNDTQAQQNDKSNL